MSTRRKPVGAAAVAVRRHRRPDAQAGSLLERLAALARLVAADAAGADAGRYGLDAQQWRMVAALGDGATCSATEVAARSGLDRATVSRGMQALARGGFVERSYDAFDARRALFRLSTKGRALHRRVAAVAGTRERRLLAALAPAERRELERLLAKLARGIDGPGVDEPGGDEPPAG